MAADSIWTALSAAAQTLAATPVRIFLSPGSLFWLPSLAAALALAAASLAWPRLRRGLRVRGRALARVLFPKGYLFSPSSRADFGLFLFNLFPAGILIGWAILSAGAVSRPAAELLARAFGPQPLFAPPHWAARALATLALFLAYELAYWLDHWLSHRVPLLWAFHKVHHTAEALTPLTVYRVHPVDSLVFVNITAVVTGLASAALGQLIGPAASLSAGGTNLILAAFFVLTANLQHSHAWISFPGALGRVVMSPAHHQIHHSENPAHFNRNFGSCLCLWDWAFGTLHAPQARRERLRFGAAPEAGEAPVHSVTGVLITPFLAAGRSLAPARPRPAQVRRAA
jgi:sterol desaturase/sphingolipid hydroxylase (fatty acid hydroxylase superfamily)